MATEPSNNCCPSAHNSTTHIVFPQFLCICVVRLRVFTFYDMRPFGLAYKVSVAMEKIMLAFNKLDVMAISESMVAVRKAMVAISNWAMLAINSLWQCLKSVGLQKDHITNVVQYSILSLMLCLDQILPLTTIRMVLLRCSNVLQCPTVPRGVRLSRMTMMKDLIRSPLLSLVTFPLSFKSLVEQPSMSSLPDLTKSFSGDVCQSI